MKIESILKRKGGTLIELINPARTYLFAPENGVHEAPHVCEVEDGGHIKTLLRIKEGFRQLNAEDVQDLERDEEELDLKTSTVHNAVYTIKGGEQITLALLVRMAFDDSGLDVEAWNELEDADRYQFIDTTLAELVEGFRPADTGAKIELNTQLTGSGIIGGDGAALTGNTGGTGTGGAGTDQNLGGGNGDVNTGGAGAGAGVGQFAGKTPDDYTKPQLQELFKEQFKREPDPKMTKPQLWKAINPQDDEED